MLLVGLCFLMYLAAPQFFSDIWNLLKRGELMEIAAYIGSYGEWAVLFAFLLTVVANAIGFPPAMIFSASCTLIFGVVPGILLAWVAETVGAIISFLFFRTFCEIVRKNLYRRIINYRNGIAKAKAMDFASC